MSNGKDNGLYIQDGAAEDIYPGTTDNSAVTPPADEGIEKTDPKGKKLSAVDGKLSKDAIAGLDNTKLSEKQPIYDISESEREIRGENNARIILGRDRCHNITSGYGGKGHTRSGAIDLVVGLQGWAPSDGGYFKNERDPKNPKGKWIAPRSDKNFGSANKDIPGDAARIYISQRADIDDYFDLATGNVGRSIADSAIGIKADSVRIISRKGIKLVTQKNPPGRNSLDGKIIETFGIDLIAGNRDYNSGKLANLLDQQELDYLQPIPKGHNLVEALQEMTDRIARLNYIIQNVFAALIPALVELQIPHVGACATSPVMTIMPTTAACKALITAIQGASTQMELQRKAIDLFRVDFLTDKGAVYINSRYNRTN